MVQSRRAPKLAAELAQLLERLKSPVKRERRCSERTPIPYVFELFPVPNSVPEELAVEMVVFGKDISEGGIGFFHQRPIPYRRGQMVIELPDHGKLRLEVELLWCRFTNQGWYESGGRLLAMENEPDDEPAEAL